MNTINLGKKSINNSTAAKANLCLFEQFITLLLLMQKWKGLFLEQNFFVEKKWCWDCLYLLNWSGTLTLSILITLISRKWDPWFMFFPLEAASYLYQATIWPWLEYCCHIRAAAHCICLEILDEWQKRVCGTVGPSLTGPLEL